MKGKEIMAKFVKCEQCSFRFRPEPLLSESSTERVSDEDLDMRCPRCDTLYVAPEVPTRYWRLYCIVGLAAGFLVAGGMLLSSWLGSASRLDVSNPAGGTGALTESDGSSSGDKVEDEDRPEPVLPGAVAMAPEWLDTAGPFNPHDLFAPLKPERNAAPLYLEALIGFSSELAICVDEEFREPRMSRARERSQEFVSLFRQWNTSSQSVDFTELDVCIAGYREPFDNLAMAQRRPRCVFDSDLNLFAEQRHVNAAREAANVASLKIQHTLRDSRPTGRKVGADAASEDKPTSTVERSLATMQQVLRLSRDLRARGRIETQLASLAIDQTMLKLMPQLVARSELTVADCDRITQLLTQHRAEAMSPFVEGLRAEYLLLRSLLQDLQTGTGLLPETQAANEQPAEDGTSPVPVFDSVSPGYLLASKAGVEDVSGRALEIDTKLTLFGAEDFEAERDTMDAVWTDLFRASSGNAGLRREAALSAEEKLRIDTVFVGSLSQITELADRTTWWEATLNSLHCVVAIRRWELEHTEPPPDLLTAVRRSGVSFVPVDPFGGGPLRVSFANDEAMIYSVGPDGVDDAGRKVVSSEDANAEGDIVFRIPYRAASAGSPLKNAPGTTPAGF
jgi:hypothetical protein